MTGADHKANFSQEMGTLPLTGVRASDGKLRRDFNPDYPTDANTQNRAGDRIRSSRLVIQYARLPDPA